MLKILIPCFVAICFVSSAFSYENAPVPANDLTVQAESADRLTALPQEEASDLAGWTSAIVLDADAAGASHGYAQPTQVQPRSLPAVSQSGRNSGGFFSNLMELERRKNAWLRRNFLNR